jgi:hypothetical protein
MTARISDIVVLLLLLVLTGCGVKGQPVQAGKPLPAAPAELTVRQIGADLQLAWTIPTVNQDGTPLTDLSYFAISRLSYRAGDYCDECLDAGSERVKIYLDLPTPAIRIENRFYLRDFDLPLNVGYRYRVIPINSRGEAGTEVKTHRVMFQPPSAPTALQAKAFDSSLRLNWEPVFIPEEQGQLLGTNLYRAVGDRPFGPYPLNSQPLADGQYQEYGLENGETYRYGLRSLVEFDGEQIESEMSEVIEASPVSEF